MAAGAACPQETVALACALSSLKMVTEDDKQALLLAAQGVNIADLLSDMSQAARGPLYNTFTHVWRETPYGKRCSVRVLRDVLYGPNLKTDPAQLRRLTLLLACRNENGAPIVWRLLALPPEAGVDAAAHCNAPLRRACGNREGAPVVRMLLDLPLERGVDPADCQNACLCNACSNVRGTDIVRMLLELPAERGVDAAAKDNLPLRNACCNPNGMGIARLLLSLPAHCGVDMSHFPWDVLGHATVSHGKQPFLRMLLDVPATRGPSAAALNDLFQNVCRYPSKYWAAKMLLDLPLHRGVDPAAHGNRALRGAALAGDVTLVHMLLALPRSRGVDVGDVDPVLIVARPLLVNALEGAHRTRLLGFVLLRGKLARVRAAVKWEGCTLPRSALDVQEGNFPPGTTTWVRGRNLLVLSRVQRRAKRHAQHSTKDCAF